MAEKKFINNIKSYFKPVDDGLTFRERLGKMGLAAVLSYGWVSNMSYCVSVSLAWFIFSKQVRAFWGFYEFRSAVIHSRSADRKITFGSGAMERFLGGVRRILCL
jgi:hypothetical protein